MNKIKACLFDLDGVVVDTAKYHYLAWKRLASSLGFDFTKEDNERLKGVSRMRSLEILLSIGKVNPSEGKKIMMAQEKNSWYVEYISKLDESEILPGVKDFLIELRRNGIKIALGSASKNSMMILNNLNLTSYFDAIVDGNKVSKAKPDPEVFLLGASELKVQPSECVVFEDAQAGIDAAKAANMKVIGIGQKGVLLNADKIFEGLSDAHIDIIEF
ncbi:beta-phosphoglucomutase [Clostridium bowmanii]|uniref:beta-phosphoglucomutase n=1 Tax=Clostridium bowmanii TaxID=132925 RepID=UPI001C0C5BA8|nr:beta-phosphoglucomutase [Clostridium bowmanii]MBU3188030.1 beta-phosphoglucomutase [Clostridium bowmanii]MCA1072209.1 beta-phosphoglucomutase [Clostridium bowmanii]